MQFKLKKKQPRNSGRNSNKGRNPIFITSIKFYFYLY